MNVEARYKELCRAHTAALARSARDTLWNFTAAHHGGWTSTEYNHWVRTAKQPPGKRVFV